MERDSLIRIMDTDQVQAMLPTLESGMVPKMEACLRAVEGGVPQATVVDGRVPHVLLLEILTDQAFGTMIRSH